MELRVNAMIAEYRNAFVLATERAVFLAAELASAQAKLKEMAEAEAKKAV
jgi:hypothetical protein